jgi:DNA-binding beta-propeller fold protein YncE
MSEDEQVHFFVSYTKVDEQWAKWITWTLEDAGYRCLLQAWDFRAGSRFVGEMHRATTVAERTLAVFSPAYFEAEFAESEWGAAVGLDPSGSARRLVPVRVAECRPEGLLAGIVYIDLVETSEAEATERLLAGVKGRFRPDKPPDFPPRFPGSPSASTVPTKPDFPLDPPPGRAAGRPDSPTGERVSPWWEDIPWIPVAGVVAVLAVAAVIAALVWPGSDGTRVSFTQVGVSPRSLALGVGKPDLVWVADPTQPEAWWLGGNDVRTHQIFLSATSRPTGVAVDAGKGIAWVVDEQNDRAWRIDIGSKRRAGSVDLGRGTRPQSAVVAGQFVWVANRNGTVSRIDTTTNSALEPISIGGSLTSIAAGGGAIWVTDTKGDVVWRIAQGSLQRDATNDPPLTGPRAVAYGEGAAWVANRDGSVTRIGADGISTIKVSRELCGIAVDAGSVWVSDPTARAIWQIDPGSKEVKGGPIEVEDAPCAIAAGDDVWVANRGDSSISRIQP